MAITVSFIYAGQTKNLTFLFLDYTKNNNKAKMVGSSSISIPKWLEVLLTEKFFNACLVHELERKNEENVFCLDCCFTLCLHCLPSHQCHKLLQIRRYVYQDVLRLKEADKLLDCSFIQSYTTNSAKVVFLNQRPITRQFKSSLNYTCILCDRSIQRPNLFCSISCKVQHMVSCSKVYNLIKYQKSSITTNSSGCSISTCKSMAYKITTNSFETPPVSACSSISEVCGHRRRKSVPQRSPFN